MLAHLVAKGLELGSIPSKTSVTALVFWMQPDSKELVLNFVMMPASGIKICSLTPGKNGSQFSALQPFIVKFQEYANKVLAQQTKGFLGTERKLIIDNFHSLKALTPAYAGLIRKTNPSTLEEEYNLVRKNYTIYVEREEDEDVKATSKWNSFSVKAKKKEPSLVETLEAKIKEM
ncbi:hypothetical protein DSO57_1036994 [Entomophthora muscae]|uniref:Uncharacterized protein n=1 Tax=Entomophthora muscae TaxID=34485 RepID=A0ACC2RQ03_9FUNG|nr:hypothetical protein DSO57_1036994 [Entomophthora muscae]